MSVSESSNLNEFVIKRFKNVTLADQVFYVKTVQQPELKL